MGAVFWKGKLAREGDIFALERGKGPAPLLCTMAVIRFIRPSDARVCLQGFARKSDLFTPMKRVQRSSRAGWFPQQKLL